MKKIIAALAVLSIVFSFCACSKEVEQDDTGIATTETTSERVVQTTSPVKTDADKGKELSDKIGEVFNLENAQLSGLLEQGSFVYQINDTDPANRYKYEASEEYEALAKENAQKLVDAISDCYPDEITLDNSKITPVGDGDNGIDSAIYELEYYNTQNQLLYIIADSSGEVVFARCEFTW